MFIKKPISNEVVEGTAVVIECQVVGDPKPEVFWLRDFLKVGGSFLQPEVTGYPTSGTVQPSFYSTI